MQRTLLIIVLIAFSALTGVAVIEHGIQGIFTHAFANRAGMQVFFDAVVALGLCIAWMWNDAKATGRNPWPWIVITLTTGSFGPLLYLLLRKTPTSP